MRSVDFPVKCPKCGAAVYACFPVYEHYDVTVGENGAGAIVFTRIPEAQHGEESPKVGCVECDWEVEETEVPEGAQFE